MKLFLLSALLLLLPFEGKAQRQDEFGVHLVSAHWPNNGANNFNPGMFYRNKDGLLVGAYQNSVNRTTTYLGVSTPEWYRMSLSFVVASGYHRKGETACSDAIPKMDYRCLTAFVIPSVRLFSVENGPTFHLSGGPATDRTGQAVVHLTALWTLK